MASPGGVRRGGARAAHPRARRVAGRPCGIVPAGRRALVLSLRRRGHRPYDAMHCCRRGLVAAVHHRDGTYRLDAERLDAYLVPKRPEAADPDEIRRTGRGIAYTRSAFAYLYRLDGDAAPG